MCHVQVPAMRFMTSDFYFRHRLNILLAIFVLEMLVECGGVWLFDGTPALQVRGGRADPPRKESLACAHARLRARSLRRKRDRCHA